MIAGGGNLIEVPGHSGFRGRQFQIVAGFADNGEQFVEFLGDAFRQSVHVVVLLRFVRLNGIAWSAMPPLIFLIDTLNYWFERVCIGK